VRLRPRRARRASAARPRVALAVAAAVAAAATAAGQSTQQDQRPTFRAAADFVITNVIVRDAAGRFVPGLTPRDFVVTEDGVPQTIERFVPVTGGRVMGDLAAGRPARRAEGLVLPESRAEQSPGRIFVIFIDDLHLQPADTIAARRVLAMIRDVVVTERDLVALVSTGFSGIATGLTYDYGHARLNEAIGRVMGSADTPADILDLPESSEGVSKLRHNVHVAFRTAYGLLDQLAPVTDRRKTLLYVSSGYAFNPFEDSRYERAKEQYDWRSLPGPTPPGGSTAPSRWENPYASRGQQFAETDLAVQLAELTRAARRANVVFYAIDPRGLVAGPPIGERLTVPEWNAWITTSTSTLQILAEETGGMAIVHTNDFRKGLQRVAAETSDYYMIGYQSTNPDPLRVRRVIAIEVPGRPEVELLYRREYRLAR
jgi:VWFA-related protein